MQSFIENLVNQILRFNQTHASISPQSFHRFDTVRHGYAVDVDDDGGLLVEFPDGKTETVSSGEASVRGMYGYV